MPKRRKLFSRDKTDTLQVPSVDGDASAEIETRVASLLVVQGAEYDLGRHVLCDRPITVGRTGGAELVLRDGSTSRRHCRIERMQGGHYILVDLGSTNGTSLNGRRIRGQTPLREGDKVFVGSSVLRFSFADALDLQYQARLQEMVTTDPLTGLLTQRQYDALFDAMSDRAISEESTLSVLVMDMDGLKQINDTHGHEMGGYAITEVAAIISELLEEHGVVSRFGGDEFVGCFAGTSKRRARDLAESVRDRVARHEFIKDEIRVRPTISIGIATFPDDIDDPWRLFNAADQALYKAKRAGRNQVAEVDPDELLDPTEPDPTVAS